MAALRIGLTGGIGSGKSTVAAMLVARGLHLVDTDAIARELTQAGGAGIAPIAAAFGAGVIDRAGALDREAMRTLAFADAGAKARLEAILHPLIGEQARARAAAAGDAPLVFDVPLLAESSPWRARVDRIVVVDCGEAAQIARVAARPGWSEEAARRVIAQQAARARRRAIADAVIHNDGITLAALAAEVAALLALWLPGAASESL
ncbi:MAG: dephospho-CoA kinase [Rubrivivax sp.]